MSKDDISLGLEMGKLEIEPCKAKQSKEDNPFTCPSLVQRKNQVNKSLSNKLKCSYCSLKKIVVKKKPKKILKEPILKLLQNNGQASSDPINHGYTIKRCLQSRLNSDNLSLCALVDNYCNQLKISPDCNVPSADSVLIDKRHDWKPSISSKERKDAVGRVQTGSCSQQALNPPCDVTIDELASYFETLVHIPKKMSTMAEMMYI